jgi:adenylate cyclase
VTEIKNRNYFDQQFQLLWQQTVRRGGELSLLLCDIDYFKAYNDQYGHPAGDRCLQAVAQTLEGGLVRRTDWVARYGGEEFAIVLPDTHLEGATLIAERLQDELRQRCLPHRGSRVASVVTISIGIASLAPSLAMAYQDLIDEADRALYLAKQQGRDCYVALRTPV